MKASYLASIISSVNAAIDKGLNLPFDEVRDAAKEQHLLEYLKDKLMEELDLSMFSDEEKNQINYVLYQIAGGLSGRERKKTGVERNGLCLTIAYLLVAIQNWDTYLEGYTPLK